MSTLEEVKTRIFATLVSYPKILTVLDLEISYLEKYGERIPFVDYGYKSLDKFIVKIPDITIFGKGYMAIVKVARLKNIGNNSNSFNSSNTQYDGVSWCKIRQKFAILTRLLENNKKTSRQSEIQEGTSNCRIPVAIQNNLKNLIVYFTEGLQYNELPIAYQNCFAEVLDFRVYNYDSLLEMCMDLKDIFLCFSINDVVKLFHKEDAVAKYVVKHEKIENSTPPPSSIKLLSENVIEQNICDEDVISVNVMKINDTIPRQFIPMDKKTGDEIDVFVTDIYDLSKFWIILQSENTKFDKMHNDMQSWYKKYFASYKIPQDLIKCNLYCVAMYENQYYRGIVVKILPLTSRVKVFFFDYGTLYTVCKTKLLFLNKVFAELPQQAIRARLARIQPNFVHSPWSEESFDEFFNLVQEKYMVATIIKKSNELQEVAVILVDKENNTCVNEVLVKKKLAIFHLEKQDKLSLHAVPTVDYIHLYPTFDEIEQGIVPSAEETHKLLQSGLEYDYIFPHYFRQKAEYSTVIEILPNLDTLFRRHNNTSLEAETAFINTINGTPNPTQQVPNRNIKQQLEYLIFMNIRNKNIVPLYYIQYLLRELSLMDDLWESVFDRVKEDIMSITSTDLQNFFTGVLDFLTTEKLLELYIFLHHTMSNIKFINKIGPNEISNGKIIGKSDFNGNPIYLYRINKKFYVDLRDIRDMMHAVEISLSDINNQLDMLDFIRSVLVISVQQSPLLMLELQQNTIPYLDCLIFLEVQFIPRFCEILANGVFPKSAFTNFFEKIASDGWSW